MKERIIEILIETSRKGMPNLIDFMDKEGFFEAPASSRFHGCYPGGLAKHSLNVYEYLYEFNQELSIGLDNETVSIAALLHDLCKVGCYIPNGTGYKTVMPFPQGHSVRSLELIKKHIELTELEEMMIRYHMGVYGLKEFDERSGEYNLRDKGLANVWYHHPAVKVMYFCDELATLREKGE